ncbi:MAG: malonyl-ACP O-methyltransferase BioC [bacterium]|nr:malonyl-ACP O-methyltransferase BioC [bacterium]
MLNYKEKINLNFSKAALNYDREAVFQQETGRLLVDIIRKEKPRADTILDLGTGTGFLIDKISNFYPKAQIYGLDIASGMVEIAEKKFKDKKNISIIEGDIDALPFPRNSFDLIISNASLQWCAPFDARKDLENTFKGIADVLKEDGVFYANLFGEKTFNELRSSLKTLDLIYPLNFLAKNALHDLLKKSGFISHIESKLFYKYYPDLMTFLKKVKEIGAGNITPLKDNLGQRKLLSDLDKEYTENFKDKKGLKVTYELITFKTKKAGHF